MQPKLQNEDRRCSFETVGDQLCDLAKPHGQKMQFTKSKMKRLKIKHNHTFQINIY